MVPVVYEIVNCFLAENLGVEGNIRLRKSRTALKNRTHEAESK